MKVNRHAKIIELIGKYHIETQEELADYLNREGFKVDSGNGVPRYPGSETYQDSS